MILFGKICGVAGQLLENLVQVFGRETAFEICGSVQRFDLSVDHDGNAVAIFGFVHVVRSDENCYALVRGMVDKLPELPSCGGVHSSRRLVQKDQARLVKD